MNPVTEAIENDSVAKMKSLIKSGAPECLNKCVLLSKW